MTHTLRIVLSLLLLASGCASKLGSRSLPQVRMNYTESVATSGEQQMLLNLVRLRHSRLPVSCRSRAS